MLVVHAIADLLDVRLAGDDALGEEEARGQIVVVAGSAHSDGDVLAGEAYLQRLFDGQAVEIVCGGVPDPAAHAPSHAHRQLKRRRHATGLVVVHAERVCVALHGLFYVAPDTASTRTTRADINISRGRSPCLSCTYTTNIRVSKYLWVSQPSLFAP